MKLSVVVALSLASQAYGTLLRGHGQRNGTKDPSTLAAPHAAANVSVQMACLGALSSESLNDLLQASADASQSQPTVDFLRTLRLCARCGDFERVGEPHDGGYIICADGLANSGLQAAFSYGIQGRDGWGMDLASRYRLPLFEFDCFDHTRPTPCYGCQATFVPECIKGNNEYKAVNYKTLSEHLAEHGYGHAADSSLLLKVDVEGAEWNVFSQESPHSLRQFRQINLELHDVGRTEQHALYHQAMQAVLNAGFSVAHLHGNNHGHMAYFGQYMVPNFMEVTLIRQGGSGHCPADIPYRIPEDQTCNPVRGELPNARLPSAL